MAAMKRGAKRAALSDLAPEPIDTSLRSKRVMEAFDVHRAESSHQHLMAGPPLDVQRAESSRQHVRALNTQFASWVQSQLQNHPDELWEDGVKDYLSHASNIMEKFKDIVDWLKANVAKSATIPTTSAISDQKIIVDVPENNSTTTQAATNNGFVKETPFTSFSSPQSSGFLSTSKSPGLFSFSQPPATTVNQTQTHPQAETSGDIDKENDLEQPSSPSLKKTEEKGVVVVHEAKCKVYVKPDNPAEKGWKDMGMGQLSIRCKEGAEKASKESKPIIVVRNEVGKILLNALIYPGIKMNIQKNTIATIFHTLGGGPANGTETDKEVAVARTYLLRMKTEEETTKLSAAIKEHAPAA
ncbi:nuclear pore complex protein Nup50 protein [Dioscorea alata]|uniref:Nuclear pore complex protein Nup50 protein n=5 Tax=Dioscorea alata TaxID=55571 RepID=A0ACB7U027_DIOAL|nr:nuclear pore complex protein Nup50 protein [Dioscorea alata]KAH7653656.1 nuclear pore complex protein Nup50 protein [Dioscorea alata]